MSTPVERALAELRAIPMRKTSPEPQSTAPEGCCSGDRRGYQWHQRSGNLPACPASHEAAIAYGREYLRVWRAKNPDYHRRWRAQQQTKGGTS